MAAQLRVQSPLPGLWALLTCSAWGTTYYSQCQSVTTSTIVKRRWHWICSVKRRYTKYLDFSFSSEPSPVSFRPCCTFGPWSPSKQGLNGKQSRGQETWTRPPGRPRRTWLNLVQEDANAISLSSLWRTEIFRGHGLLGLRDDDDDDEWMNEYT